MITWLVIYMSATGPVIIEEAETRKHCEELAMDYGAKCAMAVRTK